MSNSGDARQQRALRLIAAAFTALAGHLLVQTGVVLATASHPRHSSLGIAWTALTAVIMFALAVGKGRTGRGLDNPVLLTESRVTVIDGPLAGAVLLGLLLISAGGLVVGGPRSRPDHRVLRPSRKLGRSTPVRETGALTGAPAEVVTPGRVRDSACCGGIAALPDLGGDLDGVPR